MLQGMTKSIFIFSAFVLCFFKKFYFLQSISQIPNVSQPGIFQAASPVQKCTLVISHLDRVTACPYLQLMQLT